MRGNNPHLLNTRRKFEWASHISLVLGRVGHFDYSVDLLSARACGALAFLCRCRLFSLSVFALFSACRVKESKGKSHFRVPVSLPRGEGETTDFFPRRPFRASVKDRNLALIPVSRSWRVRENRTFECQFLYRGEKGELRPFFPGDRFSPLVPTKFCRIRRTKTRDFRGFDACGVSLSDFGLLAPLF